MSLVARSAWFAPAALPRGRFIAVVLFILLALAAGKWLQPRQLLSDAIGSPQYAPTLPQRFGDWERSQVGAAAVVNPVQSEMLAKIYTETVSAAYVHRPTGRVLMLSIAYGRNQSSDTQLHTPEMCYSSQGFKVDDSRVVQLPTTWGALAVRQVPTRMGNRPEPLTYFIRNAQRVTTAGSMQRNLARMEVALRGYIGDGLLVRVSEVTPASDAFALQAQFMRDYLGALTPSQRELYIGRALPAVTARP